MVLFDTARFPQSVGLTVSTSGDRWDAGMSIDGAAARSLGEARSVWWRRPLPFRLHDDMGDDEDRAFAYGECHAAVTGLWSCLDARWVNDPDRDQIASRKMLQLKVATALGLRVPRTCMTNEPEAAKRFVEAEGEDGTIYKSFAATEKAWRETRLLRPEERELLDNVRFAPVIFQEHIPAVVDLRVTVVGEAVFPAEIRSQQTGYLYDFRMTMDEADLAPHKLPDEVVDRLLALMTHFGLVYGAVDMRLTPDGEYVFLEVNPAGQWLFVELRTGQPITEALCDALASP